jgi:hypothetical protein
LVGARRVGALCVLTAIAGSCAAIIGADEEPVPVARAVCDCPKLNFHTTCVADVTKRLGEVSEEARVAWMQAAAKKGCFASCSDTSLECYRTAPACSKTLCNTGKNEECCEGFSCDPESKECF